MAEQLLAGPQYRERGTIRLRAVPGGFAQVVSPWRVEGTELPDAGAMTAYFTEGREASSG